MFAKGFREAVFALALSLSAFTPVSSQANKTIIVHSFDNQDDGGLPLAGLLIGPDNNLYGTDSLGGAGQHGAVFKLTPAGDLTVLYSFSGASDGGHPQAGLIADAGGNLYGTAAEYGDESCQCGVIFRVTPQGQETVLHAFTGGSDGAYPLGGLTAGADGNFYGTTSEGGAGPCSSGCGTVFELASDGTETPLYTFAGGTDGAMPSATLFRNSAGDLYGTTDYGGIYCAKRGGCGTVFSLAPEGAETVLHSFRGGRHDGLCPCGSLISDQTGNFYGVAQNGGSDNDGAIFKLKPDGTEHILHFFHQDGSDGMWPLGALAMDNEGNLFGTTAHGPGTQCGGLGCGTVFKLAPNNTETMLHTFADSRKDGAIPNGGLVIGKRHYLYGTTYAGGGHGYGTVFKLAN